MANVRDRWMIVAEFPAMRTCSMLSRTPSSSTARRSTERWPNCGDCDNHGQASALNAAVMEQHLRIRSLVRISVPYTPAPQMTALRDQATAEELASATELGLLAEEPDPNEACLVLNVW